MSSVICLDSVRALGALAHERFDRDDQVGIFASPSWFEVLETNAALEGHRTVVATIQAEGSCQLALPLFVKGTRFRSMSNFYSPTFAPIELGPLKLMETANDLVRALCDRGMTSIELGPLVSGSPFFHALRQALRRSGFVVRTQPSQANWYLPSEGLTWSSYFASRPSRLRHTIRRCERRLANGHQYKVDIVTSDCDERDAAIAAYESVYAKSWKRQEPCPNFVAALCRMAARMGWLRLGVLTIDGRPVAAQVWFFRNGVASIYKLAYDEQFSHLGVGTVLTAAMFRHSLDVDHAKKIDYLTGDEPYKREWMLYRQEREQLLAVNPWHPSNWSRMTMHAGRRLRSLFAASPREPSPTAPPLPGAMETAVVVGLCAHGLAIVRALAEANVPVVALESDENLPGFLTRHARVVRVADINGDALVAALVEMSDRLFAGQEPTLLLTNDTMVALIARHVDALRGRYRLSWSDQAPIVSRLLRKENIEARCVETGLAYPKSVMMPSHDALKGMSVGLRFPVIAKPTKPLSSFKTIVASTAQELVDRLQPHAGSAPFVLQEFVPGGDDKIHFCALYLDKGRTIAHFEGRKLRSRPMGHTTLAETHSDSTLLAYTQRFFEGLHLSGPVSLEVKRDDSGTMWVIEPTVGRTDFWVGLCIRAGISLPRIEHDAQRGRVDICNDRPRGVLWFNGERDPLALAWLALTKPSALFEREISSVYFDRSDWRPWIRAVLIHLRSLARRVWGRTLGKIFGR